MDLTAYDLKNEKAIFDKQGYIGPYDLSNKKVVDKICQVLEREWKLVKLTRRLERYQNIFLSLIQRKTRSHRGKNFRTNRHLDIPEIQELLKDPNLTFALKNLCSSRLLLWRTFLTHKAKSSQVLGWHHDKHFENGDQKLIELDNISRHFSMLVAINDMTETNGVFRVVEGSHKAIKGYERDLRTRDYKVASGGNHVFYDLPEELEKRVKRITLKKGQFILFHSAILHGSEGYVSGPPRFSLAMRFVADTVDYPEMKGELKRDQLIAVQ